MLSTSFLEREYVLLQVPKEIQQALCRKSVLRDCASGRWIAHLAMQNPGRV